MNKSGIKITADEYFTRQKDAEELCRSKIKSLILQALFFVGAALFSNFIYYHFLPTFFIFFGLLIFLCFLMAVGSLFMIKKAIKNYKYQLERIVEYMLTGGIVIEIPQEDYEKFDVFKTKKEKYKAKSINKLKNEELKRQSELKAQEERKAYERKVEEEFQKQYYSDSDK
jgi:hypothetical protein